MSFNIVRMIISFLTRNSLSEWIYKLFDFFLEDQLTGNCVNPFWIVRTNRARGRCWHAVEFRPTAVTNKMTLDAEFPCLRMAGK